MQRTELIIGIILSAVLALPACSRTADERADQQRAAMAARDGTPGDEVTITGCLMAAQDRNAFVVTADRNALVSGALYSGSGETPTFTYELTGNVANLAAHVGRQVEVTGRVDKSREDEVKVNDEVKTNLPETQSGKDKVSPAIETDTEVEVNVRRLTVSSMTPTGQGCLSGR
jgi:hypothetical protein